MRIGILTISDKGSRGEREDLSGQAIRELAIQIPATVERYKVVPDEVQHIARVLIEWADSDDLDVILTTGGTGLAPRDVTPEATLAVIHRTVPGIPEALRQDSLKKTAYAMLSRAVAGVRGKTLIINMPGSPAAVRECVAVLVPVLPHAVAILRDQVGDHGRAG